MSIELNGVVVPRRKAHVKWLSDHVNSSTYPKSFKKKVLYDVLEYGHEGCSSYQKSTSPYLCSWVHYDHSISYVIISRKFRP